jgi:hypothetical protein
MQKHAEQSGQYIHHTRTSFYGNIYAQNKFCGYREKRTKVRWSIPSVRNHKGNRVVIAGVCQSCTPPLYMVFALVIAAPPLYRRLCACDVHCVGVSGN